ncbi:hypothetical protein IEQ44_02435 [Nocardioides sp. Y6]|uniref:Ig-like domain-containing protein n=1 Tax=Nocardioides malaquae TaxID=2773426 RepID=A0ABR9RPK7_9ACTN|nr:hypothetical protein [Nocardioides malaquae]MBE7323511.1 hypothetical protein [Nocardioides malaquae]
MRTLHSALRTGCVMALLIATAACGDRTADAPEPAPEVTSGDSAVRLVEEEDADLVLWVSNQSFDDETVTLVVEVDGVTVVDGDFAVEGQHNWIKFPLAMPAGEHEITAESDTGATLTETFRVPGDAPRYAVIDHWGESGSAELTWLFRRQEIAFA